MLVPMQCFIVNRGVLSTEKKKKKKKKTKKTKKKKKKKKKKKNKEEGDSFDTGNGTPNPYHIVECRHCHINVDGY